MGTPAQTSLAEAKRLAVTQHVLAAARRLALRTGLDVTMDQIAEVTGVSRRTLFRQFTSREKLLASAFDAGIVDYRQQLPPYDGELDRWLRATCVAAHRMNATIGPGFFELASRRDLPPDLHVVEQRRRRELRAAMDDISETLWRAGGAHDTPPRSFVLSVSGHLSPYFTAAITIDGGQQWSVAAELACAAIRASLTQHLTDRPGRD